MKYVRDTLAAGDRLAQYLLPRLTAEASVHAFLPPEIDVAAISNFSAEAFLTKGLDSRRHCIEPTIDFVRTYLAAAPSRVAVWEGWPERLDRDSVCNDHLSHFWNIDGNWSVWDGPGGTRSPSRTDYIYTVGGETDVAEGFRWARTYPTICTLTKFRNDVVRPAQSSTVDNSFLSALAENADHVVLGAFDERGCLIVTVSGWVVQLNSKGLDSRI